MLCCHGRVKALSTFSEKVEGKFAKNQNSEEKTYCQTKNKLKSNRTYSLFGIGCAKSRREYE